MKICFHSLRYQNQNFSLMLHSRCTRVVRVALVSFVEHSYRTRVVRVSFISFVCSYSWMGLTFLAANFICHEVFEDEPIKNCGKQPLKIWSDLSDLFKQTMLLQSFLSFSSPNFISSVPEYCIPFYNFWQANFLTTNSLPSITSNLLWIV